MTTIAYKDGVIAYDSRMTQGPLINSDSVDKHKLIDGVHYFLSGSVADEEELVRCYQDRDHTPRDKVMNCAFVVDGGKVYEVGLTPEDGFWMVEALDVSSIGSGSAHALTAMDCGLSAREAVKMAIKRDPYSGGRIRTFKVKK